MHVPLSGTLQNHPHNKKLSVDCDNLTNRTSNPTGPLLSYIKPRKSIKTVDRETPLRVLFVKIRRHVGGGVTNLYYQNVCDEKAYPTAVHGITPR